MTEDLASYYDVPLGNSPMGLTGYQVDLSGTPYGGLLTQGAFLATHASPVDSSPSPRRHDSRAPAVQTLAPPPANLDVSPRSTSRPPPASASSSTGEPACAGCHELIDPVGYGFEAFDGIGRHREQENGLPIDTTGAVVDLDGASQIRRGRQARRHPGEQPKVEECYVTQWVRFGHGLTDDDTTACRSPSSARPSPTGGPAWMPCSTDS